jgi:hypothetical protein
MLIDAMFSEILKILRENTPCVYTRNSVCILWREFAYLSGLVVVSVCW